MTNAIKIYGFPLSGHSHRVELFASLAGIAYENVLVNLAEGEHKQPEFLALNPAGQVPVIEDAGQVLADSNAILVYLARQYAPDWLPTDPTQEAEVQKYLTLAAGEIAFGPAASRLVNVFKADLDKSAAQAIAARVFDKLEAHLVDRDYLVGDRPSIADVAIYSYTAHAPEGDVSLQPYPNIRRLLNNIEAMDGFVPMPKTPVGLAA